MAVVDKSYPPTPRVFVHECENKGDRSASTVHEFDSKGFSLAMVGPGEANSLQVIQAQY